MESSAVSESKARELDRISAFSDGVFAIAITLLVIGIEVPDVPESQLTDAIDGFMPDLVAYFIGFAVIGLFWYGHHRVFSTLRASSPRLVLVNMLLLSMIALMPFTTGLLGEYNDTVGVVLFAINVGFAATFDTLLDVVVRHEDLMIARDERTVEEVRIAGMLRVLVFVGSIPVALVSAGAAQLMWLGLFAVSPIARRLAANSAGPTRPGNPTN